MLYHGLNLPHFCRTFHTMYYLKYETSACQVQGVVLLVRVVVRRDILEIFVTPSLLLSQDLTPKGPIT